MDLLRANLEKLKTTLLLMLSVLAYGRKISSTYVLISQRFARMFSSQQAQQLDSDH
jgi:hypothetical protein